MKQVHNRLFCVWKRTCLMSVAALIAVMLLLNMSIVHTAHADSCTDDQYEQHDSTVYALLTTYDGTGSLSVDTVALLTDPMEPMTVQNDDVQVILREVVYDGIWLYAAADIMALNPDEVMIMPGAAWAEDPRNGMHGEKTIQDERTYMEAAAEDNKRLLAVYIYPKEFDSLNQYLLDYWVLGENCYSFVSGGCISSKGEDTSITWLFQIYEVDPVTCSYTLLSSLESEPQPIVAAHKPVIKEYLASEGASVAYPRVQLIKTPITTYFQPYTNTGEAAEIVFEFTICTEDGTALSQGTGPDIRALTVEELPEMFTLKLNDSESVMYNEDKQ